MQVNPKQLEKDVGELKRAKVTVKTMYIYIGEEMFIDYSSK